MPHAWPPASTPGAARRALSALALLLAACAVAPAEAGAQDIELPPPDTSGLMARARAEAGIRVCGGGDVLLGTNLDTTWIAGRRVGGRRAPALPDPHALVAPLRPLLADADVVLLNVEGAIGEGPALRQKCSPESTACFAFRSPPESAPAMRGVAPHAAVIGNVANNHARDNGWEGLRQTVNYLRAADVTVTGTDTLATPVVTASGDTVAFLGFSQWIGPDPRDLPAVRRHVRRAAERYPRLVVTMHMGAEGNRAQRTPNADEHFYGNRGNSVAFARAAVESGAGLVLGHGPHVMRAVEWHGDGLIFYSLGNLLTYGPFSMREPQNRGGLACAVLDPDGRVIAADLRSTRQTPPGWVAPDPTARAAVLADSLGRLDFPGTAARLDPVTGEVRPSALVRGRWVGGAARRRASDD